jgi:universal stress protein E
MCNTPATADCRGGRPVPSRWSVPGLNDRILYEADKLATLCNAQLDVIYAHDLTSLSAAEFGFDHASAFFSSSAAKALFDAQGEAFRELAERNDIPAENQHMIGRPGQGAGQLRRCL